MNDHLLYGVIIGFLVIVYITGTWGGWFKKAIKKYESSLNPPIITPEDAKRRLSATKFGILAGILFFTIIYIFDVLI